MSTGSQSWTEEIVEVAGTKIQFVKGGSGDPLLILHGEMGYQGWLRAYEGLAQHHTLYIPTHPGFGESKRLDWVMNMRDLAGWYLQALNELGLGQINVAGFSLGGWLAAEIATMCPHQFKKMVLVSSPGIKPPVGEIFDMFLVVAKEFMVASCLDISNTTEFKVLIPDDPTPEQMENWERAREEACRLSWRPYMFYPALPHLLGVVKNLPTLIVWGRQDAIVPLSVAEVYNESISDSRLVVLDDCGHRPEVEKVEEFVPLVLEFLAES